MKDITVTVSCIAYNHEKYISDAIEGFLMQKTDFLYEVFIHDDASTDRTAEIVRQYEKKNPDKVKGIYQKKNQYSQGASIIFDILLPMSHGKYIALCEGDDYWKDPCKLQKQVEAMERHPECAICAHGAIVVDSKTNQVLDEVKRSSEDCIFMPEEVIAGGGGFVVTSSLMIEKRQLERDAALLREFPLDYFIQIMGSIRGGMFYIADSMSCYRWMVENSWSERMHNDLQRHLDHIDRSCAMLEKINIKTGASYEGIIEKVIAESKIHQLELKGQCRAIIKNYAHVLNRMPRYQILRIYMKAYFPWIRTLRNWIRSLYAKQ